MSLKGIILAGGHNTRLWPAARVVSKQLLPVYDKPMICYPLTTLMQARIRDVLIITRPTEAMTFRQLYGDGECLGMQLDYSEQDKPRGLAHAFHIASEIGFAKSGDRLALILGDNIFHGAGLEQELYWASQQHGQAVVFLSEVQDPTRYGVADFDGNGEIVRLFEKPSIAPSNWAVTGLYFYDSVVLKMVEDLKPSGRGELEITDLNNIFVTMTALKACRLKPGQTWLDMGTPESLLEAGQYVRTIQKRQGVLVGSPEETAYNNSWITAGQLFQMSMFQMSKGAPNEYGKALRRVAERAKAVPAAAATE